MYYCRAPFLRATNFENGEKTLVASAVTLYDTCKPVRATSKVTCKDTMNTCQEKLSSEGISVYIDLRYCKSLAERPIYVLPAS